MAKINLSPGTLSPPACYEDEQQRFEAFVAKIVATIVGGFQWEFSTSSPVDLQSYWLRKASDGRARGPANYIIADGRWVPWLATLVHAESSGGVANAYTATTGFNLLTGAVKTTGRQVFFIPAATNTGASTLDVDGVGASPIVRHGGTALLAGDLVVNAGYIVVWNSTGGGRWELATPVPPSTTAAPTYFESTGAVPAAGAVTTIPHGQLTKPEFVDAKLVCTSADRGFSVGDEIDIEQCFWSGANTGIPAFAVSRDTTNIVVQRPSEAVVVFHVAKTGGTSYSAGAADQLTLANWSIKVNAIFVP